MRRPSGPGAQPIRVALAATVVVGILWALISIAVIALATVDLTNQIDARLQGSFNLVPPNVPFPTQIQPGSGARAFGPLIFIWRIAADGSVTKSDATPDLPPELAQVSDPKSVTIDGVSVRVAGHEAGDNRVVVAQSLQPVVDTQRTILLGTLIIAPLLLAAVFIGALAIGRRVAKPLEAMHHRQLDFTADASH